MELTLFLLGCPVFQLEKEWEELEKE